MPGAGSTNTSPNEGSNAERDRGAANDDDSDDQDSEAGTTTADDTLKQKSRDASVVSGGHLVAKALKSEGVDTIFTLCGGHIIDIYDGCVDEGIRIIDVRHEQVAAHAADGYARQTGKLGVVVTTASPGFTNAMTGIATAFRSESLRFCISGGQGALTQAHDQLATRAQWA